MFHGSLLLLLVLKVASVETCQMGQEVRLDPASFACSLCQELMEFVSFLCTYNTYLFVTPNLDLCESLLVHM